MGVWGEVGWRGIDTPMPSRCEFLWEVSTLVAEESGLGSFDREAERSSTDAFAVVAARVARVL